MAKLHKMKNELLVKRNIAMGFYYGGLALLIISSILFVESLFFEEPGILPLIFALLGLTGLIANDVTEKKLGIYTAGVKGEKSVATMIASALPDGYHCITNMMIHHDGRASETDLVVLGETGIFVVEIKNYAGNVYGAYADQQLQHQTKNKSKEEYNPVKQVATHVDRLSRFLRDRGVNTWVHGAVFFCNPKGNIQINGIPSGGIPVFDIVKGGREDLLKHLQTPRNTNLSGQIDNILSVLGVTTNNAPNS